MATTTTFGADNRPLTEHEKAELLRVGQWGNIIFSLTYPSYDKADKWADKADMVHGAEYGEHVHNAFKKMFESNHDSNVVVETGRRLSDTGGLQSMQCNFYNYNVITMTMCMKAGISEQAYKEWWGNARVEINKAWDGVGGWQM